MEIVIILVLLAVAMAFAAFIFALIIEPAYVLLFNRPMYVHFYPVKQNVTAQDELILPASGSGIY